MSIDVTVLIAWIEIRGNNSKKSSEKHAHDLHFALVTKVLLRLLHSATAEPHVHVPLQFLDTLMCFVIVLQGFLISEKTVFLDSLLLLAYPATAIFRVSTFLKSHLPLLPFVTVETSPSPLPSPVSLMPNK